MFRLCLGCVSSVSRPSLFVYRRVLFWLYFVIRVYIGKPDRVFHLGQAIYGHHVVSHSARQWLIRARTRECVGGHGKARGALEFAAIKVRDVRHRVRSGFRGFRFVVLTLLFNFWLSGIGF